MNNMKKTLSIIIVIAVIVGGGAFFVGYKIGRSGGVSNERINGDMNFAKGNMQSLPSGSGFGVRNGGGMTSGEILSKDDNSITIKLNDGGSKIVFYSEVTEISKTIDGIVADLEVGKTVMVSGTTNQDGSITAKTVQLRPIINVPVASPRP